jgi:hypothetical protein
MQLMTKQPEGNLLERQKLPHQHALFGRETRQKAIDVD